MSATQEFGAPDITASDYYQRLGAPPSAGVNDVDNHTKKYVAEFKPELSTHENADERWKRFNRARQTLNSPDSKEDYDTFRDRFGPDQAAEAYEIWQANDALGPPNSVSARDLGLESEVDESESGQRSQDRSERHSSGRQRRQQRSTREERQRERRQRRQAGETDIDTDSSKTYSTRATDTDYSRTETETNTSTDQEDGDETGTASRVVQHVRSTIDLAATEVSTMLSLLDLVVAGYALYVLLVEFVLGNVPILLVRDGGTAVVGLALVGVLSWEYLDRFSNQLADGGKTGIGNQFMWSEAPVWFLALPALFAVLWSLVLLSGGAALTILLLAVSVAGLYGRFRGLRSVVNLPDWTEYAEPAGGILAAIVFIALFIQSGQVPGNAGPLAAASTNILAGIGVALLALIGLPIAAIGQRLIA